MRIRLVLIGLFITSLSFADTWDKPNRTVIENTLGDKVGVSSNRLNVNVQDDAEVVITDGTQTAAVLDTGSNDSLAVGIVDASGNQITSFGGTAPSSNSYYEKVTCTGAYETVTFPQTVKHLTIINDDDTISVYIDLEGNVTTSADMELKALERLTATDYNTSSITLLAASGTVEVRVYATY